MKTLVDMMMSGEKTKEFTYETYLKINKMFERLQRIGIAADESQRNGEDNRRAKEEGQG